MWRSHYDEAASLIDLYRSHATQNKRLLDQYGLEGEADARDIIVRQEAALVNMQDRIDNLICRNRVLEEDVRQLEEQMDGVDDGYDFRRHGPGL
jgi:hypothetical protein